MSERALDRDPHRLLDHDDFLRALARSLVADAARADDVVQQAYAAALASPTGGPRQASSLRAWLASVVRHLAWKLRRSEQRRALHERAAARSEALSSVADVVAREQARRRVVEAVLALEEPTRTTMLLRYFDRLPPRAIAKQLGVPVDTVRTRIRRALERLRGELDAGYGGDRGAWLTALLPFAKASPAGAIAATTATAAATLSVLGIGVLVMSTKAKALSSAAVLTSVALAWLFLHDRDGSASPPRRASAEEGVTKLSSAAGSVPNEPAAPPAAAAPEREVAVAPAPPTESAPLLAALRVTVLWGEDQTPAAGVGVHGYAWARPQPYVFTLEGMTDSEGHCRIDGIEPGKVLVMTDRGDGEKDAATIPVRARLTTNVTLTIPPGVNVEGEVVDEHGSPVGDADIWVGDSMMNSSGGLVITHSDGQGRFSIRSLGGMRFLNARAAEFTPSLPVEVRGTPGTTMRVKLALRGPGGVVRGRVVDAEERPIAGARLQIGDEEKWHHPVAGGFPFMLLLTTTSDAGGSFEFPGVMLGEVPLAVRARGWAPWRSRVTVDADRTADVTIVLERGVTIEGRVSDEGGQALAGVELLAGIGASGFRFVTSRTNSKADGTFRLANLASGTFEVRAELTGRGTAKATLTGRSGELLRWDPVLKSGLELRGRVVDEDDGPVAGWYVHGEGPSSEGPGFFMSEWVTTDAQGCFVIRACPATEIQLVAQDASGTDSSRTELRGVRAGGDEVVVRVESARRRTAWIEGEVLDADGKPCTAATILVLDPRRTTAAVLNVDPATARFRLGPYAPGDYRVAVAAPDRPSRTFPVVGLALDEVRHLGTLRLERGGSFRATVRSESGSFVADCKATCVQKKDDAHVGLSVDSGVVTSGLLLAGDYELTIEAAGFAAAKRAFTIRAGETTELELMLERVR